MHLQRRVVEEGKHRWQIEEVGIVMQVAAYALALRLQLGHSDGIQALGGARAVTRSLRRWSYRCSGMCRPQVYG